MAATSSSFSSELSFKLISIEPAKLLVESSPPSWEAYPPGCHVDITDGAFDGALVRLRSEGDPSLDASHASRRESARGSVPFACVGCEKAGGDEQMRTKLMVTTKMAVAIGMVTALVP